MDVPLPCLTTNGPPSSPVRSNETDNLRFFQFELLGTTDESEDLNTEADVTIHVGREIFHGNRRTLSYMSNRFADLFASNDCDNDDNIGLHLRTKTRELDIVVEAPVRVFEVIFHFCYSKKLSVPVGLVPSIFLWAKRLRINVLRAPCVEFLIHNITICNIGEICHIVSLHHSFEGKESAPKSKSLNDDDNDTPETCLLARAIYSFLHSNADLVASSLTGQLSNRLIVNLTGNRLLPETHRMEGTMPQVNDRVVLTVLHWAHERIVSGERLASYGEKENVQSDDEENTNNDTNESGAAVCAALNDNYTIDSNLLVTLKEPGNRMDCRTNKFDRRFESGETSLSANPKPIVSTRDVRITLNIDELPLCDSNDVVESNEEPPVKSFRNAHNVNSETETCLLVPTTLGVGCTTIWLGKLVGRLVSISIKWCQQPLSWAEPKTMSTSQHMGPSSNVEQNGQLSVSCVAPGAVHTAAHTNGMPGDSESMHAGSTPSSSGSFEGGQNRYRPIESEDYPGETKWLMRMLCERSGAGVGLLQTTTHSDVIALCGGYMRKGCLDSVELYQQSKTSDDLTPYIARPILGPRLRRPRGRLAIAGSGYNQTGNLKSHAIYACGGSTGSKDLNSVERLTSPVLTAWLTEQQQSKEQDLSPDNHPRSSLLTPQGSSFVWEPVRDMHFSRNSPCAVGLDGLSTGPCTSFSHGSILVAGGQSDAQALSSVEAFIADRNEWIMLPEMKEGRYEASCSLIPSQNLIVVAGGTSGLCHRNPHVFVEALDLRCPNWITLPAPNPGGRGKLHGASLVRLFNSPDDKLLLLGGFNGEKTLNTTWIFDFIACNWIPGPPMLIPRAYTCAVTVDCGTAVFGGFNTAASASGFLDTVDLLPYNI